MTVKVIGKYPILERKRSGLFSLDMAMAHEDRVGIPLRGIHELYGYTNSGKSTLSYFLAGKLAKDYISICDLELADLDYIKTAVSKFNGTVKLTDLSDEKNKPYTHEKMLNNFVTDLFDNGQVGILDSVGAIIPVAEAEGDFGEAFMGKRAKLVSQVVNALSSVLRSKEDPSVAFVINHVHNIIGGRGHVTAGGERLKYMAVSRTMLWTQAVYLLNDDDPHSVMGFHVSGKIEKLRYGGRGKDFGFYIVPGQGVHEGASALMDCIAYGIAESKAHVKLAGKSYGFLKAKLLRSAYEGETKAFEPFIEALHKNEKKILDGIWKRSKEEKDANSDAE